ncbi:MAG: dihydropteroate synthase [Bacteroidota bacterium]
MGVINVGPDSFYDGGRYRSAWDVRKQADKLLSEGAAILDVGAVSTRPGARLVDADTERKRLMPALEMIVKEFPDAIISVDTYNSVTARAAIESGAHIINDISAGEFDAQMFTTIAELQVPYIIMHIKGTPETMQENPVYEDVVREITLFFAEKVHQLQQFGVHDIILDPGFGFGKSLHDNYLVLDRLDYFRIFELPILVGFSRKSMVNKVLGTKPANALNGTTVLNTIALQKGANILRVHDAREAHQAVKIVEMLQQCKQEPVS